MSTDRGREFARLVAVELSAEGRRRHVTQRAIAQAAGISAEQMSYYVHGRKGPMTTATLLEAAEFLGIDPQVIADRAYAALLELHGPRPDPDPDPVAGVVDPGVTPGTRPRRATPAQRPAGPGQGRRGAGRPPAS